MFNSDFLVLEFGYSNIKLIVATVDGRNVKIKRMDLIPTIEGSILGGRIIEADKVAGQISNHLIQNNIKAKKTILTITGSAMLMREVAVHNHNKSVIKSFIDIEASNFFPIDLSTCVIDYKIIPYEPDDKDYKILLLAIPNEIIDEYLSVTKILGLKVSVIDFTSDSIARLYSKRKKYPVNTEGENTSVSTAIIDIGATMTSVTITTNDVIKYNKIINFGFTYIAHAISIENKLDSYTAELEGKSYDVCANYFNNEPTEADNLVKVFTTDFIENLTVFFDFHASRKTGNKIDNMVLIGEGAYQKGISDLMEDVFSAHISRGFEFSGVHFDKKIRGIDGKMLCFYNCIGASVKA